MSLLRDKDFQPHKKTEKEMQREEKRRDWRHFTLN